MAEETNIGWTVISLLPIILFFALFTLFGGYLGREGNIGGRVDTTDIKTTSGKIIRVRSGHIKKILLYIGLAKVK